MKLHKIARIAFIALIVIQSYLSLSAPMRVAADNTGPSPNAAQAVRQTSRFIVIFKEQLNVKTVTGKDRQERQRNLLTELQRKSETTQTSLRALLGTRRGEGRIASFTPLWILNAIAVTGDTSLIAELAAKPEVAQVIPDAVISAPTPLANSASSVQIEPNISLINAPALWNLGFFGQGVVIASLDTGVDIDFQPDLRASWRGGSNSWFDPYGEHAVPADLNGHGTWTMGLLVGKNSGGSSVGVAPQAKWIAAKIFNDAGSASSSAIHQSLQWLLNPSGNINAPDPPNIVNNSWTLNAIGCNLEFEPDLQALVAAGIVPIFSAGNLGPNGQSDTSPANNPSAFAVGAVDNNDIIATFSSRGSTSCGRTAPATFPAVVAPGVAVNTTDRFGLFTTATGTSFSAPHVAGAMALLLSANSTWSVAQLENALVSTAIDLGPAGPDNAFGAGRIDVLRAYNRLTSGGGTNAPDATATPTASPSPTATDTPVPSSTPTSTALPENTATATATETATPENTATATATATSAPDKTATPTATSGPTTTATHKPEDTVTSTPTRGPTKTATLSPTSSTTATRVYGPTKTPTPTVALRPSPTTTPTPVVASSTPSRTPTRAMPTTTARPATATVTMTATPTRPRPTATATATVMRVPTATAMPRPMFMDGFESGNTSAWSSVVSDNGRLSVAHEAAITGQWGLRVALGATGPAYVAYAWPATANATNSVSFIFSPNGVRLSGSDVVDILVLRDPAGAVVLRQQLQSTPGGYRTRIQARTNGNGDFASSDWINVSNAAHFFEVTWKAATTNSSDDGKARLTMDGNRDAARKVESLRNGAQRSAQVRLGVPNGVSMNSSGALYFDEVAVK